MEYIIQYHPRFSHYDTLSGVIFEQYNIKNRLFEIFAFQKEHPNLQIRLRLSDEDYAEVAPLIQENKDKYILIAATALKATADLGKEYNIPICAIVSSWSDLSYALELGYNEIEIFGDICFELNHIKETVPDSVKVVCCPNIAQGVKSGDVKNFYIAPQDMVYYEPYIAKCILASRDMNNPDVIYEAYAIDKTWEGALNYIIIDGPEMDRSLGGKAASFVQARIKCGKRCLKNRPCGMCDAFAALCGTLSLKHMSIIDKENDT
jgi:hypothetical protein